MVHSNGPNAELCTEQRCLEQLAWRVSSNLQQSAQCWPTAKEPCAQTISPALLSESATSISLRTGGRGLTPRPARTLPCSWIGIAISPCQTSPPPSIMRKWEPIPRSSRQVCAQLQTRCNIHMSPSRHRNTSSVQIGSLLLVSDQTGWLTPTSFTSDRAVGESMTPG